MDMVYNYKVLDVKISYVRNFEEIDIDLLDVLDVIVKDVNFEVKENYYLLDD